MKLNSPLQYRIKSTIGFCGLPDWRQTATQKLKADAVARNIRQMIGLTVRGREPRIRSVKNALLNQSSSTIREILNFLMLILITIKLIPIRLNLIFIQTFHQSMNEHRSTFGFPSCSYSRRPISFMGQTSTKTELREYSLSSIYCWECRQFYPDPCQI